MLPIRVVQRVIQAQVAKARSTLGHASTAGSRLGTRIRKNTDPPDIRNLRSSHDVRVCLRTDHEVTFTHDEGIEGNSGQSTPGDTGGLYGSV